MPTKASAFTVTYRAWDVSAQDWKEGDSANHTLKVVRDNGSEESADNSPSEIGGGVYKLTISATEANCDFITWYGASSTGDIVLIGGSAAMVTPADFKATGFSTHDDPDPSGYLDAAVSTRAAPGAEMALTSAQVTALVAAIEAEIADDATGEAVKQAIVDKLVENLPDLDDLTLTAIANAARDAILNRVLAGNHDTAGTLGKLAQNMDAAVSSRNSVTPDAAGTASGLISALQTHGDDAWATATGFSTHAAADVVTALLAAESYEAILSAAGYYKHEVTVLTRDETSGEVLTATHKLYDADGELLKTINYTGTVNAQGTLTAHKKEPA